MNFTLMEWVRALFFVINLTFFMMLLQYQALMTILIVTGLVYVVTKHILRLSGAGKITGFVAGLLLGALFVYVWFYITPQIKL